MSSAAAVSTPAAAEQPARSAAMIGALGVVFGDIGTSPIYAFRESLKAATGAEAETTVLGVLSLVFWAITLVVAIKYVVVVMRSFRDAGAWRLSISARERWSLPIRRAPRAVKRVLPLRHEAFEPHLARMCEDGRAVAFQMLIEPQAKTSFGQHTSKRGLADFKRIAPQVVAIQLDQVEGVEEHPGVVLPVAQPFPPWPARALG